MTNLERALTKALMEVIIGVDLIDDIPGIVAYREHGVSERQPQALPAARQRRPGGPTSYRRAHVVVAHEKGQPQPELPTVMLTPADATLSPRPHTE
jgi:hypothetical protein